MKLGTKFTIQTYEDFDQYVLITEFPGDNVIRYEPMTLAEIHKRIHIFFKYSRVAIELQKERAQQQLGPAA